ncbi:amino acid ABC transporter permease [soil metagenome]
MTAVLYDPPGPRGRRRILIGSVIGVAALALIAYLVIAKLADAGQFRKAFWEPFTRPGVQRILWNGLKATLKAAGLSLVLALLLGVTLAALRLSKRRIIRTAAGTFVEVFRGLPLLLLVFFAFLGLPRVGIEIGPFGALVIALSLYNGAVLSEIFRAGVNAVPPGQVEAAASLGLSSSAVFRLIQLPQAVRTMLPSIISQLVVLMKDTSLGFIVAYEELLRSGRLIYTNIGNVIPTAIVVASIYIVINLALTGAATLLEHRQRRTGRGASPAEMPPVALGIDRV